MSFKKSLLTYAFLAVVSLLSALGTLLFADQVLFRFVNAFSAPIKQAKTMPVGERLTVATYHPILGYDGVPNLEGVVAGAKVTQNSRGNRGPDPACGPGSGSAQKPIIVSGDSFAWGYGVSDDSTVSAALARQLKAGSAEAPEVLNFGVSGYGPDQSFLKYLLYGRECRPKLVVLLIFLGNDVGEAQSTLAWGAEKPRFFESSDGLCLTNVPPPRARGWPLGDVRSLLFRRFPWMQRRLAIGRLKIGLPYSQILEFLSRREFLFALGGGRSSGLERVKDGDKVRAVVPCYEEAPTRRDLKQVGPFILVADIVARFAQVAKADGAEFRAVLIPAEQEQKGSVSEPGRLRLRQLLEERKVKFTDLTDSQGVPADLVVAGRPEAWRPDLNFSAQGSEIVAARILLDARRDGQL